MINNLSPATESTEQAAAYEAVENGRSGFDPLSDGTKDVAYSGGDEPQVSNSASDAEQIETKMKEEELKQVSGNGTASHTEENAKVDPPKADKEGKQKPFKLTSRQIYALELLLSYNFRFARIRVNRDIDRSVVRKKILSIKAAKGIISPFLVITALECIKAGIEVVDYDGNVITKDTPDLDKILVLVDGQHRWEAIKELLEKGESFEAYFILPLTDGYDLMTLLKEANTAVNPWDGIDWLTMVIQTAKVHGLDTTKLEWLKLLANTDNISDSAASLFASGGKKIYSKTTMKNAIDSKDTEKLEELADTDNLDRNRNLYNAVIAKLNVKTVGLKVTPKILFSFVDQLINKNIPINDAYSHVIEFINDLSSEQVNELSNAKKTSSKTKDQVITNLFKNYWATFTKLNKIVE